MNQTGFIYGGDYNPEQWLDTPEILTGLECGYSGYGRGTGRL